MENIGLIGHSRGGEAVSISVRYSPYPIKAVVALAGTDGQYRETIRLNNISYIALQGSNDGDVTEFETRSQYNRIGFTTDRFNFKATYYIEGANHAQFNTTWGKVDSTSLGRLFYSSKNNLKAVDQREFAKELSLTFFNTILKGNNKGVELLENPSLIESLPKVRVFTDYTDSSFKKLKCEKYFSGLTDRVFRDSKAYTKLKHGSNRFIELKNIRDSKISEIYISLANSTGDSIPATIEGTGNGITKTYNFTLEPGIAKYPDKSYLFRINSDIEPNFQTFKIPLEELSDPKVIKIIFTKENELLFNDVYWK